MSTPQVAEATAMSSQGDPASSPILQAVGLAKRYGRTKFALAGIDLEIRRGSITALVGPNGAGKSTLMKSWLGFERPTSGSVAVNGIDPWSNRSAALQYIGYVPQTSALYRELTVADHIALAADLRAGYDEELAQRRLDDLGILAPTQIGHLSGGQQAQVSLALALGARAEALILDEPLAGLDPLARREFLYLLTGTVADQRTTAVLSSHVVTDIEQACDHLVVLGAGQKLLDAPADVALAMHAIAETDLSLDERAVASFLGPLGKIVTLLKGDGEMPSGDGLRPASLEELLLGYLASGRPGMIDRIRRGEAGR